MSFIDALKPYLGDINTLTDISSTGKEDYVHPARRLLGSVTIVTLREIIAPTVFRNSEAETTTIMTRETCRVRATPNKFKFHERANGLKLLRHFNVGGAYPQNRHAMKESDAPSQAFDLNSLVFGDSVNRGNQVWPVKASALYSDGLSLQDKDVCVGETFHNRASEDGTLFDSETKKNSTNIFTRHFITPGTLLVQVITTNGRTMPIEAFNHLLLCLGDAGAYGGQTSISGVNVRTHLVGIYASKLERASTSPYEIVDNLGNLPEILKVDVAIAAIDAYVAPDQEVAIPHADAEKLRSDLITRLVKDDNSLRQSYVGAKAKVGSLFDLWFVGDQPKKSTIKASAASATAEPQPPM